MDGNVEEIERLIQRSMEIIGKDRIEFSHVLLGTNLSEEGPKIEKALTLLEKIPNTNPKKPILANKLGVILNALRLPEKSGRIFSSGFSIASGL